MHADLTNRISEISNFEVKFCMYAEIFEVLRNSEDLDLTVCQTVPIKEHPTG